MTPGRGPDLPGLAREIAACGRCPLHQGRNHAVPGEGGPEAKAMLIGEAPGKKEDETGLPFVGMTGRRFLRPLLHAVGFAPHELFITSVVKCRPPNNRDPRPGEVAACVGAWLKDQVALVDPLEIILLGKVPAKGLLGLRDAISDMRGKVFELYGRPVRVTFHPTAGMRFPGPRKALAEDLEELRGRLP